MGRAPLFLGHIERLCAMARFTPRVTELEGMWVVLGTPPEYIEALQLACEEASRFS